MGEIAANPPPRGNLLVREPSAKTWVPLSEALTWLAFRHAMNSKELREAVEGKTTVELDRAHKKFRTRILATERREETARKKAKLPPKRILLYKGDVKQLPQDVVDWWYGVDPVSTVGIGPFVDRDAALLKLESALAEFGEAVASAKMKVQGRHILSAQPSRRTMKNTVEITQSQMRDFCQFDLTDCKLQRKTHTQSSAIWAGHPQAYNRELVAVLDVEDAEDRSGIEAFYDVEVCRADLMQLTDPVKATRAPSVKAGRQPTVDVILAKADEMKALGMNGRTIAQQMRNEPRFENVANTTVRELIKGRWKPGGRPKKKHA